MESRARPARSSASARRKLTSGFGGSSSAISLYSRAAASKVGKGPVARASRCATSISSLGSAQRAGKAAARHRRPGAAGQIQEGGGEVGEAHGLLDPPTGRQAGPPKYQRHVQRRVVDEEAVALLAVLAEGLAVIGREGHDGGTRARVPGCEQDADRGV